MNKSKQVYRGGLLHHRYRFGVLKNIKVWFCRTFGHRVDNDVKGKCCERCGLYYGEIYHKQKDAYKHL